MDRNRFDALTRAIAAPETRRRLLGGLATLPVVGGLADILSPEEVEAKDRRRRRKQRHKRRKKAGTRKQGCPPQGKGKVCTGRCGPVKNRDTCGKTVDCGSCACEPTCAVCFTCQEGPNTPGACVVDPVQAGKTCGVPGQRCQPDGACACDEGSCPAATPFCVAGVCEPCTSHAQCGDAAICVTGVCHVCDVCKAPAGCAFTSVQAAIDAPAQLETIHVCPGTYVANVNISRSLRLIGAGDDADNAANTVLTPSQPEESVVYLFEAPVVTLQGLRMTGGNGLNGRGLQVARSTAEVIACTITGNSASGLSSGLLVAESSVTLTDSRITGNTGSGGVDVVGPGATLTLDAKSRVTGNSATDGGSGIVVFKPGIAALPSEDNVTGNTSHNGSKNCGGDGTFTGPGAICTTR